MSRNESAPLRGWPVKTWVFLTFLLGFLLVIIPVFGVLFWTTNQEFRTYVYEEDREKARTYARIISQAQVEGVTEGVDHLFKTWEGSRLDRLVVVGPTGVVEWDTQETLTHSSHPLEHLADAVPLTGPAFGGSYLLVGTMVDPALTHNHSAYIGKLLWTLLALLGGALLLTFLAAEVLSRLISGPIRALSLAADRDGSFPPAPPFYPQEIRDLGEALRGMEKSLRVAEERKAQMLADAAHELRTPLTVLRGSLEAFIDGVFIPSPETLKPLYQETLRLQKIVEGIRNLEDLHASGFQKTQVNLGLFLGEILGLYKSQALAQGGTISLEVEGEITVFTDPEALGQILGNLITNALRYGKDRGNLVLGATRKAKSVEIFVDDQGPGVPLEEREKIFERFYRVDVSRSTQTGGRGLGLAIVKKLVTSLGGQVWVESSPLGGARFIFRLPGEAAGP